jgi:hypothetical protein
LVGSLPKQVGTSANFSWLPIIPSSLKEHPFELGSIAIAGLSWRAFLIRILGCCCECCSAHAPFRSVSRIPCQGCQGRPQCTRVETREGRVPRFSFFSAEIRLEPGRLRVSEGVSWEGAALQVVFPLSRHMADHGISSIRAMCLVPVTAWTKSGVPVPGPIIKELPFRSWSWDGT